MWRRAVVVIVCFGWAIAELFVGTPIWALLFAALGAYCTYEFWFNFNPEPGDDKDDS